MSRALIGWRTSSGSCHNDCVSLWKGIRTIRLHNGTTLHSAAEATVDLHCKTVCFNELFGDVNIFSIVLISSSS
jgi:hypothetical protein